MGFFTKFFAPKTTVPPSHVNVVTVGTIINGSVEFNGVLVVKGTIRGDSLSANLNIVNTKNRDTIHVDIDGTVESTSVKAMDIIIAGHVTSNLIEAEGTLKILASARINDAVISYRTLDIDPGAQLHNCQLKSMGSATLALPKFTNSPDPLPPLPPQDA